MSFFITDGDEEHEKGRETIMSKRIFPIIMDSNLMPGEIHLRQTRPEHLEFMKKIHQDQDIMPWFTMTKTTALALANSICEIFDEEDRPLVPDPLVEMWSEIQTTLYPTKEKAEEAIPEGEKQLREKFGDTTKLQVVSGGQWAPDMFRLAPIPPAGNG